MGLRLWRSDRIFLSSLRLYDNLLASLGRAECQTALSIFPNDMAFSSPPRHSAEAKRSSSSRQFCPFSVQALTPEFSPHASKPS